MGRHVRRSARLQPGWRVRCRVSSPARDPGGLAARGSSTRATRFLCRGPSFACALEQRRLGPRRLAGLAGDGCLCRCRRCLCCTASLRAAAVVAASRSRLLRRLVFPGLLSCGEAQSAGRRVVRVWSPCVGRRRLQCSLLRLPDLLQPGRGSAREGERRCGGSHEVASGRGGLVCRSISAARNHPSAERALASLLCAGRGAGAPRLAVGAGASCLPLDSRRRCGLASRQWLAQYEQHFSPYDGAALLRLNTEKQLVERVVLPEHAGLLLAAMRLRLT